MKTKLCQIALIRQNIHQGKLCIQTHLVGQNRQWRGRLHSGCQVMISAAWGDAITLDQAGELAAYASPESANVPAFLKTPTYVAQGAAALDAGNLLPGALFGLDTPTVLVGRSAATVDPTGTLHGLVTATLYIDDRYESRIQVEGHQLKVFTATRLNPGDSVCLRIDTRSVRSLSG